MIDVLLVLLSAWVPNSSVAEAPLPPDSIQEAIATELAREIRCPICRGVSIEESPSEFARQMKAVILEKVEAGQSREEIRRYFADRYGEWVLLHPEGRGLLRLLWILPVGALLVGGVGLALSGGTWLHRGAEGDAAPGTGTRDRQRA